MNVKALSVALFGVTLALVAATPPASSQPQSANMHVADGLALPRNHQYERYETSNGTYVRVDVNQVPALVRQKVSVYDRTAQAWVYRPHSGINPQFASAGSSTGSAGALSVDGLSLPRDRQYERYDGKNATYTRVSPNDVPGLVRQKVPVYDRTARAWVYTPKDGINPAYAATAASSQGGNWNRGANNGWDRTNGSIVAIKGDEIIVREESGRQVTVNMANARTRLNGSLKVGDRVSVVGVAKNADYIEARAVRERGAGDSARSGGGQDEWARVHGRVQSVQGTSMRLRADDGRVLTVDLGPVSPQIRQALQQGEAVTVIGYDWTGPNQLRAEYVQQDSSDPSRGGSVAPSASPR